MNSPTIPFSEIEYAYVRSSGPGGQNVNKVNSKCEIRWNPTESKAVSPFTISRFVQLFKNRITNEGYIIITSDRFRDQKKNQNDCLEKLKAMLLQASQPPKVRRATRPTRASKERRIESKKVRSQTKSGRRTKWSRKQSES